MLRSFAGIYDPAGPDAGQRARLADALHGLGPVQSMTAGPLAVAWTGTGPAGSTDPWCLLDGQIYNLDELARAAGVPAAHGPEGVLAAAYRRWGEGMLERLRGDFAIVIWDRERNLGMLALDHIGVRSLCLHTSSGRLVFASEVRELARALPRRPLPDPATVAHWLIASRSLPDRTLHQGVTRVLSGHLLRLADGRWDQRRYWEPRYRPRLDVGREEAVDAVRSAIVRAVDRRLRAGEPAGITLSGGLDSSTVAGVATRYVDPARRPVGAYSATFPDHPQTDESELIVTGARAYGLRSTRIVVHGGSAIAGGLEYLRRWEVPPVSANVFWWPPLGRRAVEDGVRVLLDGEDGDGLFGISHYYIADLLRRGRVRAAGRLVHRMGGIERPKTHDMVLKMLYQYGVKGGLPPWLIHAARARRSPSRHVPPWFTAESGRAFHATSTPTSFMRRGVPRWWGYKVEALTRGSGTVTLFDHSRRRAGLVGMEMRHPFADVDLVEMILRLPHALAYDPRFSRPLVREAMQGIVPEELRLRRSKSWFDHIQRGALTADVPVIDRLLSDREARIAEYVHMDILRRELIERAPGRHERPDRSWHLHVWRLVMLECWLRAQEDGTFLDRLADSGELPPARYRFAVTTGGPQAQVGSDRAAPGPRAGG
ncbi:MAG: asparagine synthetase B family protein [Egibacteraceae bacterium]